MMRTALGLAAVVLLALACSTISTPMMAWRPTPSLRMVLGSAGVVLAICAWLTGRAGRR